MKRNKRRKLNLLSKSQVLLTMLLVIAIVPWFVYGAIDVLNDQTATRIKHLERDIQTYEQSKIREEALWNLMNQPKELEAAVESNGLSLALPKPVQCVHVATNGRMRADPTFVKMLAQAKSAEREDYIAQNVSTLKRVPTRRR